MRQREHRKEQLDEILRFAESHGCRMLHLLRHFGDEDDRTRPCGGCDACAPGETVVRRWRPPTRPEAAGLLRVVEALRQRDRQATGQLHREAADAVPERREFEALLGGLARGGLVRLSPDTFEKDGRTITFQRAALTPEGTLRGPGGDRGGPAGGNGAGCGSSSQARSPEARAQAPARGWTPCPRAGSPPSPALPPS